MNANERQNNQVVVGIELTITETREERQHPALLSVDWTGLAIGSNELSETEVESDISVIAQWL